MRPGPRQPVDDDLLALLREAILTSRMVEFRYRARSTGQTSRQRVEPLWPDLRQPRIPHRSERVERRAPALAPHQHGRCQAAR